MKNYDRRSFFKLSAMAVGALALFKKSPSFISEAFAADRKDKGITKLNYEQDLTVKEPKHNMYPKHKEKVVKFFDKNKEFKITEAKDKLPMCHYCKFYTKVDENWGYCTQLAKKGNKEGQMVSSKGWCQMFNLQSKGKLKKVLGV
ncbi:MAG: high-potential iron-sulfur protein [Halobacteriovoraceae bacterium]|nr:high-potential iron-sulfur protein [Halobacteriovoraceae bacterium]MCB9093933.1 high-potential iron-sulfur protein [Halobacteriovoraceae bacterium]